MKCKKLIAAIAASSIVSGTFAFSQDASSPTPSNASTTAPTESASPAAPGLDNAATDQNHDGKPDERWPMVEQTKDGTITVFEPQLENLKGNQLTARAAVSVQRAGDQEPMFGAVWMSSRVSTDRVARTVEVEDIKITKSHFADNGQSIDAHALESQLTAAVTAQPVQLSLDQLLAMLNDAQEEQENAADLKTDAPKVIFREHPAVLLQYDGAPKPLPVEGVEGVQRVANTPFFVALDTQERQYFLKGAGRWFSAADPLGPFKPAEKIPDSVVKLAADQNYKDPTTTQPSMTPQQQANVEIVAATEPTELVWTDGPAKMTSIDNTQLLFVENTDADWFVDINTQQHYLLLSGRWYTTRDRNAAWTYVEPDKLPTDFAKIPPNSEKGDVLAQVPGTPQADDAIADTYVPQTATIDRGRFDQPKVDYDGDPQFQPADGTDAQYAVNTYDPVLLYGGNYYLCNNAVWYVGHNARGPWELCGEVPDNFYRIRPSCPIYGVRYCHVYGTTADALNVGYTPGYVGCYPYRRTVIYGTGYRYQPWWGRRYYGRPSTFGYAARYNSYVGHWGFNFGLASGNSSLWINRGADRFTRRDVVFGYGGYRPALYHRDVNRDLFRNEYIGRIRSEQGLQPVPQSNDDQVRDRYLRNIYEQRGDVRAEIARRALDDNARRDRDSVVNGAANDAARRDAETRRTQAVPHPFGNNVFVDRDGNVYRRGDNGGWELRDGGAWRPSTPQAGADRPSSNQLGNAAQPAARADERRPEARPNQPSARPGEPQPTARPGDPQPTARPGDPQPTARTGDNGGPEPVREPSSVSGRPGDPQPAKPAGPDTAIVRDRNAELNRAAKARAAGDSRLQGYQRPNSPAPRSPAPAARPSSPAPAPRPAPKPASPPPRAPSPPPRGGR